MFELTKSPNSTGSFWMNRSFAALPAEVLRALPRTYKGASAQSTGGFRMRHCGFLCGDGLRTLGDIYGLMELMGCLPAQLWLLAAAQLPRPQGGHRAIGFGSGPYRLQSKARRGEADTWEQTNQRPHRAQSEGRSVLDPVWRAACKAELARESKEPAAGVLLDI